ncbi:MAG: hypothetical protein ACXIUB_11560 [Wenzhouxiangella sp.]
MTDSKPQSKLGIASLLTSLLLGFLMLVLFMIAALVELNSPGGMDEESIEAILIGFGFFALLLALLLPIALGIAGLFQQGTSKVLSIIGILISVGVGLLSIIVMLIGLLMDL